MSKILVLEDEAEWQAEYRDALKGKDARIVLTSNEAIQVLQQGGVELFRSDWQLDVSDPKNTAKPAIEVALKLGVPTIEISTNNSTAREKLALEFKGNARVRVGPKFDNDGFIEPGKMPLQKV